MRSPSSRFVAFFTHLAFTSIFIVLSGLIIIVANGYSYNPQTRSFQQTGIISITVKPERVAASLDRGKVKNHTKSPITFSYVLPGWHTVEIQRPGYITWVRTYHVLPGEAIVNPFVVLFFSDTKSETATPVQVALLLDRHDNPPDAELDIRGTEIWVKPVIRTYPIVVASDSFSLLSRFSTPIGKAIWLPNKTHVIFQVDNEIRVIDRDGTNDSVLVTLASNAAANFTTVNDGKMLIYQDGDTYWQKRIR